MNEGISKKRRRNPGKGRIRTEFIGGNVLPEVGAAFRQEAARRGLNLAETLEEIIIAHVSRPRPLPAETEASAA